MKYPDPFQVIAEFYPEDTPLRRLLLKHSMQVRDKALEILHDPRNKVNLDEELVSAGAMLHDVGIFLCDAPGILCEGDAPYIMHGILGAELLRNHHYPESLARICERHTGTGITLEEIHEQKLPLPEKDFLPETPEEKLICLADKFFSKSGKMHEKNLKKIRSSMQKFGKKSIRRLDEMLSFFLPESGCDSNTKRS